MQARPQLAETVVGRRRDVGVHAVTEHHDPQLALGVDPQGTSSETQMTHGGARQPRSGLRALGRGSIPAELDVQLGSLVFPGIEVVGDEVSSEIVIGRDVLSRLRLVLDGPQSTLEFAD